uniref:protein MIS12 homolog n=1 Tax=Erigeron canadensis TaxID=72917 RepID=UPI001CB9B54A|nr:protein MIS12 homolog [Erigeron canadensis]
MILTNPKTLFLDLSKEGDKRLKMDVSEGEATFDSLDLNPQLFINSSLNIVDQLVESAFDYLHQEASTQLKIDSSERSEDLTKGLDYIRNTIQSALDKRFSMWEKFCFLHIFALPDGFLLPKDDEASGSGIMDVDFGNSDLDVELASLKTKLLSAEQESAELKTEIQALERQSVISNQEAASVNELTRLSEQMHENDAFEELQKLATELRTKMEKLNTERGDGIQRARLEKVGLRNGDVLRAIGGNGFSNMKQEKCEGLLAIWNTL